MNRLLAEAKRCFRIIESDRVRLYGARRALRDANSGHGTGTRTRDTDPGQRAQRRWSQRARGAWYKRSQQVYSRAVAFAIYYLVQSIGYVMINPRLFALALGFGAVLASGTSQADGNVEAGKIKAITCMGCHAIEGAFSVYPSFRVPKLSGQHSEYVVAALKAYKSGQRKHKTMVAQAGSLSEQDMQDIAAYFAAIGK